MREDMAKVIVERPRLGGGGNFNRARDRDFRRIPLEEGLRREAMKRPHSKQRKFLNENLAPLRRFLQSNVGRPWDKVFSEIAERINLDSAVQLHIWQHVEQYVCRDAIRNGRVFQDSRGLEIYQPFFVDSKSGLLRKNERSGWWRRWRYNRPRPPEDLIRIDATRAFRRIEGIWYELELTPLPREIGGLFDVALKKPLNELSREELRQLYGDFVYAVKKRQLNSKEIKRLPPVAN